MLASKRYTWFHVCAIPALIAVAGWMNVCQVEVYTKAERRQVVVVWHGQEVIGGVYPISRPSAPVTRHLVDKLALRVASPTSRCLTVRLRATLAGESWLSRRMHRPVQSRPNGTHFASAFRGLHWSDCVRDAKWFIEPSN